LNRDVGHHLLNTAASNGETIYPGVLTFASELLAAKIRPATTVTDLNGGNPEPGDILEYTGVAQSTGNGTATGRILVRIRAVTRGGRPIVGTRAYQTCTVKRPTVRPPRV
jgi:hypothetical protein